MQAARGTFALIAALVAALLAGCAAVQTGMAERAARPFQSPSQPLPISPDIRERLAPGGILRVGVQPGLALSMMVDDKGRDVGLAYELGAEFARWLGVKIEIVEFGTMNGVIDAMRAGQVDFTLALVNDRRRQIVDYTLPILHSKNGPLALAVPRGRQYGMSYLSRFAITMRRDGTLQAMIRRAGLEDEVRAATL